MVQTTYGRVNTYTPGASLSPDLAASYAATNYVARNAPTDRTYTGYNRGYQYNPGESQDSFIMNNAEKDAKSPATAINWMNPVGFGTRAVQGKSAYKRQQAEYEQNMRNYQLQLQQRQYGRYQEQAGREQQMADQQRNGTIDALDRAFHSPARVAGENAQYDAALGDQVAGINTNFRQRSQAAGLAAARNGRLGSSYDAETQGGLASNAKLQVLGAQNTAADQKAALADQDQQQYEALRRALLSGDPQAAMSGNAQAAGISGNINRILQGSAQDDRNRLLAALGMQNTVDTVGNVASAAGSGVYAYYGNPQYGGYNHA